MRHGLVLQGALAALVADRAIKRVVDQQEFQDAALGLIGLLGADLGLDLHAGSALQGAGRLRLGHAAPIAHVGHLDHALAAGPDRVEQRVVAETRDVDADHLGGADHQRALGHLDLGVVDEDADQVAGDDIASLGLDAHACAPSDCLANRALRP